MWPNIVFIVLLLFIAYWMFRPAKGLKTLGAQDFEREMERGPRESLLIDVREPAEFRGGHLPGARNIPLSQLSRRLEEIPRDRNLLLYCRSGMRSKNAARLLGKNGYRRIAHLRGGIGAWRGAVTRK